MNYAAALLLNFFSLQEEKRHTIFCESYRCDQMISDPFKLLQYGINDQPIDLILWRPRLSIFRLDHN